MILGSHFGWGIKAHELGCVILINTCFHHLWDGKNSMYFIGVRGKDCKVSSIAVYSTVNFKIQTTLEVPSIVNLNILKPHRKVNKVLCNIIHGYVAIP